MVPFYANANDGKEAHGVNAVTDPLLTGETSNYHWLRGTCGNNSEF